LTDADEAVSTLRPSRSGSRRAFKPIMCLAMAAAAHVTPVFGETYPWCANFADGAGVNCGFSTREQCMATSIGSGGTCTENNEYRPAGSATALPRHQTLKHRFHKNP
jgi:Protein of unknown function (DUF3551)